MVQNCLVQNVPPFFPWYNWYKTMVQNIGCFSLCTKGKKLVIRHL
nr:MAG TPA: hypothetical protein [Caudoviricetes sp.]